MISKETENIVPYYGIQTGDKVYKGGKLVQVISIVDDRAVIFNDSGKFEEVKLTSLKKMESIFNIYKR